MADARILLLRGSKGNDFQNNNFLDACPPGNNEIAAMFLTG